MVKEIHPNVLYSFHFRALNAFLNTGKGGTVYLGVIDSGKVMGLQLSEFQVSINSDHTIPALNNPGKKGFGKNYGKRRKYW